MFFIPHFLNIQFDTDEERTDYILEQLTNPKNSDND